jgi:hypothetical protein
MDARAFDAITRRASLLTLGAAGLATLGLTGEAGARKRNGNGKRNNGKNRKNRKQNKGDANKRCKQQVPECEAILAPLCEGQENCDEIVACCSSLGQCNVTGFFDCLIEAQQPQP